MRACDNPFRVQRLAQLTYRLHGTTWDSLLARLATLDHRAALVGPEGHGKSTLLDELGRRLAQRGYQLRVLTLRRGERALSPADRTRLLGGVSRRDLILIDGAQELSLWQWSRLSHHTRRAGGLLITSHQPGLLPTLHECRTTPELLSNLIAELLGRSIQGSATVLDADAAAFELFSRHRGNLRDALLAAYDLFASSPSERGKA